MNGESKQLLDALKEWMLQLHNENRKDIKSIFRILNHLPCDKRQGFYTYVKWHLGALTAGLVLLATYVLNHLIK